MIFYCLVIVKNELLLQADSVSFLYRVFKGGLLFFTDCPSGPLTIVYTFFYKEIAPLVLWEFLF
ncbi:hypothetical protein BH11BAC3_BH11BAC3_12150 [soil metagenome]